MQLGADNFLNGCGKNMLELKFLNVPAASIGNKKFLEGIRKQVMLPNGIGTPRVNATADGSRQSRSQKSMLSSCGIQHLLLARRFQGVMQIYSALRIDWPTVCAESADAEEIWGQTGGHKVQVVPHVDNCFCHICWAHPYTD